MIENFQTDRLLLKELIAEHISDYTEGFLDYEVIRHMNGAVPWPYPENGVKDFLEATVFPFQGKTLWQWGVFLKSDPNKLIGSIVICESDEDNRGFWLAKPYWGQGYMIEALAPITDYAFNELGFDILRFTNARGNAISSRIKERMGARLVDVVPKEFVDSQYTESERWELTKEAWQKVR